MASLVWRTCAFFGFVIAFAVVLAACGTGSSAGGAGFSSEVVAQQVQVAAHIGAIHPAAVAICPRSGNFAPKQFAQQNPGERFLDGCRRAFQYVGNPHLNIAAAHTDKGVCIGETPVNHRETRYGSPRPKLAEDPGVQLLRSLEQNCALDLHRRETLR